jgi:hypothetical protein
MPLSRAAGLPVLLLMPRLRSDSGEVWQDVSATAGPGGCVPYPDGRQHGRRTCHGAAIEGKFFSRLPHFENWFRGIGWAVVKSASCFVCAKLGIPKDSSIFEYL